MNSQIELPPLPPGYETRLPRYSEETQLVVVGRSISGHEVSLEADTAKAWHAMREAAEADAVTLLLVSGFRSVSRQAEILRRKLKGGRSWDEILRVSAYPGFSEHHTGRAIDIGSPESEPLAEIFASTREFRWLTENAGRFGFRLSYPRGNPYGIAFEPWHWFRRLS